MTQMEKLAQTFEMEKQEVKTKSEIMFKKEKEVMKEEFEKTMNQVLTDKLEAAKAINNQQIEQVKSMALKLSELEKQN